VCKTALALRSTGRKRHAIRSRRGGRLVQWTAGSSKIEEGLQAHCNNTSRGSIVDDGALVQALTARTIAGAALDVFDTEPLPADHPFRSLENVLATPHIGYVAEDLYRTFYGDAAVSIAGWLNEIADSNRT
jgi:lactate dehydrogenase-like 2-hydroxyacid dehydrogenase